MIAERTKRNCLSNDPAMGKYFPQAPVDDEAKKANGNLPGMGGVFNPVNLSGYGYAGNNPLTYVDPDGNADHAWWEYFIPVYGTYATLDRLIGGPSKSVSSSNQTISPTVSTAGNVLPTWPVAKGNLNTVYGKVTPVPMNNGNLSNDWHGGLDIGSSDKVKNPTPDVMSIADGVIVSIGWDNSGSGFGNQIIIEHANGNRSLYNHLTSFSSGLIRGSQIKQGQVIGIMGKSGTGAGIHLDFRIKNAKGEYLDPMSVLGPLPKDIVPNTYYLNVDKNGELTNK